MVRLIQLCQVIILAVILLASTTSAGRIYRLHRSVEEVMSTTTAATTDSTKAKGEEICQENTPCGWAVYTPFTRKVDYFMKNTCVCTSDNNTVCLKTDDDISASAFVYRCRPLNNNSGGDTNSS